MWRRQRSAGTAGDSAESGYACPDRRAADQYPRTSDKYACSTNGNTQTNKYASAADGDAHTDKHTRASNRDADKHTFAADQHTRAANGNTYSDEHTCADSDTGADADARAAYTNT